MQRLRIPRWLPPAVASAVLVIATVFVAFPSNGRSETIGTVTITSVVDGSPSCASRLLGQQIAIEQSDLRVRRDSATTTADLGENDLVVGSCGVPAPAGVTYISAEKISAKGMSVQLAPSPEEDARSIARLTYSQLGIKQVEVIGAGSRTAAFLREYRSLGGRAREASSVESLSGAPAVVVLDSKAATLRVVKDLHSLGIDPSRAAIVSSAAFGGEVREAAGNWVRRGTFYAGSYVEQQSALLADYLRGLARRDLEVDPTYEGFVGYLEGRLFASAVKQAGAADVDDVRDAVAHLDWTENEVITGAFPGVAAGLRRVALYQSVPDIDSMRLMGMPMPGMKMGGKEHMQGHHMAHMHHDKQPHEMKPWGWSRSTTFM
ncbi:MAG TPA: ABC transporter substrate-binding protein [Actinomycetota bacterium]|nr:ABC transporter substrate-binding protein [Actinomycetota bacterium]